MRRLLLATALCCLSSHALSQAYENGTFVDGYPLKATDLNSAFSNVLPKNGNGWTGLTNPTAAATALGLGTTSAASFASLSLSGKPVLANVNRASISPSTTSVSTTPAVIFPAGTYYSILITPQTAGVSVACTGDGSTPVLNTNPTAVQGQPMFYPAQPGGLMPTGAVKCVASGAGTITATAN